ncbi:MAG: hemerythrin domain-containing protein [Acidobacteriota bacterium]|nr:hemerythrin domain-containing protein [Acidobacteriota bacterium]
MDALNLLKADHRDVETQFRAFERTTGKVTWERAAKAAVRDLSIHAAVEEQIFYPAVTLEVPDLAEIMLRSLEAHNVVEWLCSAIESTSSDDDRFGPRMTVLIDNVRLHVEEEEDDVFPEVRQALSRRRLNELGELLAKAKSAAPTPPHPRLPDTAPAKLLTGVVAGAVDRALDATGRVLHQLTP